MNPIHRLIRSTRDKTHVPLRLEPLEPRQLLSATIDLRLASGGKQATVDHVGQVIDMELFAIVRGQDGTVTNDALQSFIGSLLSTNVGGGSALGTLSAVNLSPFGAIASSPGNPTDLDGDGDLDLGGTDELNAGDYFVARAGEMMSDGARVDGALEFKVASLQFTVTSLLSGGRTEINFRKLTRQSGGLWREDGANLDNASGTLQAGAPVVLSQPVVAGATLAADGTLRVRGDNADNIITVGSGDKGIVVNIDALHKTFAADQVHKIVITANGGDDRVSIRAGVGAVSIDGGAGNDSITGGAGNDKISGKAGDDTLSGGGGNDTLDGGTGKDKLIGQAGDDTLLARDNTADLVDGGAGRDKGKIDSKDTRRNVETLLA